MMRITSIEVRLCRDTRGITESRAALQHGAPSGYDFLVVSLHTDEDLTGTSFGFAGRNLEAAGELAIQTLAPFLIGKDPLARERHWHDLQRLDRAWNLLPVFAYSPFDICLWDLAGRLAGQPLYQLLGNYRDKMPTYVSSYRRSTIDDYVKEVEAVRQAGFHAYKLHPPGNLSADLEAYDACRSAAGPDFALMADPVATYTQAEALTAGRALEKLNYRWFEEPLRDSDLRGLSILAAALDIPICSTEVLPGHVYSTAQAIEMRAVDIVRSDVSWKGGITPVLKTAHLAEAFGMNCELHTALYHPLEIVNLHVACAVSNCEYFELLYPLDLSDFGLKTGLNIDGEGYAHPPEEPGIGLDIDWDYVDNATTRHEIITA